MPRALKAINPEIIPIIHVRYECSMAQDTEVEKERCLIPELFGRQNGQDSVASETPEGAKQAVTLGGSLFRV